MGSFDTEQMKRWAVAIRQLTIPDLQISHAQALEVLVAMTSTEPGWNEFLAKQIPAGLPQSVEHYFAAVGRTQRRLRDLNVAPQMRRDRRAHMAMVFFGELVASTDPHNSPRRPIDPLGLPWSLLVKEGDPVAQMLQYQPYVIDPYERGAFMFSLSDWMERKRSVGGKFTNPWDATESLALAQGFTQSDAAMIRDVQRAAVNQERKLERWLEVGVLDDQSAFLAELQQETADWRIRFRAMLNPDLSGHDE